MQSHIVTIIGKQSEDYQFQVIKTVKLYFCTTVNVESLKATLSNVQMQMCFAPGCLIFSAHMEYAHLF